LFGPITVCAVTDQTAKRSDGDSVFRSNTCLQAPFARPGTLVVSFSSDRTKARFIRRESFLVSRRWTCRTHCISGVEVSIRYAPNQRLGSSSQDGQEKYRARGYIARNVTSALRTLLSPTSPRLLHRANKTAATPDDRRGPDAARCTPERSKQEIVASPTYAIGDVRTHGHVDVTFHSTQRPPCGRCVYKS
jgi:hypothetical protein